MEIFSLNWNDIGGVYKIDQKQLKNIPKEDKSLNMGKGIIVGVYFIEAYLVEFIPLNLSK